MRLATAKKDERRCGACRAQAERRYRPNAATAPEKAQVNMPGMIPLDARAYNIGQTGSITNTKGTKIDEGKRTRGKVSMP